MNVLKSFNRRGLVAHYKYHGSVSPSGTWHDISGNGNHCTLVDNAFVGQNGLVPAATGYGHAINTNTTITTGFTQISLMCWAKKVTTNIKLFGRWGGAFIVRESSGQLQFYLATPGQYGGNVGYSPTTAWTHYAAIWDGSTMRMYINGAPLAWTAAASGTMSASSANLIFGAEWDTSEPMDGFMDDVRIYNRAPSVAEISQIYHQTKGRYA